MNGQFGTAIRYITSTVPTLLVLAAIAALSLWGHRNGWKAPKFSELRTTAAAEKEDWCAEHNVPESRCISCRPELVGANAADWCKEHGVPESRCTICHPEILAKGIAADWCKEHGVPESNCTVCHPEIAVKGAPPASQPSDIHVHSASSHARTPETCQTHALKVQFASPEAVKKTGVRLAQVHERPMTAVVSAAAEAQYNQDKVARVAPRTTGMMWRVDRSVGQTVRKGDLLALVDAADVGKAKAELLQANAQVHVRRKTLDRIRASAISGFRTEAELQEADATLRESTIRLLNAKQAMINLGLPVTDDQLVKVDEKSLVFLGLPEPVAKTLDPATTTANLIPILAPLDGVIVTRDAVAGEMVDPAKPVFVIADTTTMWVMADLPHEDAKRLSIGQKVTFRPGDESDEPATGTLAWISSALDERTRTLRVRAQVANPGLRLVAHTFGKATIAIRATEKAVAVPNEAIQWEGCCHVVFVRLTDDIFQPRKVKLGVKHNGFTEILIGLVPGEIVATTGSHIMKSELFKGNLGTGCAGE